MKFLENSAAVVLTLGLVVGLGCGGESDEDAPTGGANAPVDTGLPEATPLGDISAAQYAQACDSLERNVQTRLGPDVTLPGACQVLGAATRNTPAECNTEADNCVEQTENGTNPFFTKEDVDFSDIECQGDVSDLEGCGVTVGQFETCLNDRLIAFERLLSDNGCANAASVDLISAMTVIGNLGSMDVPPSCAQLQTQCPDADPFAAGP
jgi:hypothetical protein